MMPSPEFDGDEQTLFQYNQLIKYTTHSQRFERHGGKGGSTDIHLYGDLLEYLAMKTLSNQDKPKRCRTTSHAHFPIKCWICYRASWRPQQIIDYDPTQLGWKNQGEGATCYHPKLNSSE